MRKLVTSGAFVNAALVLGACVLALGVIEAGARLFIEAPIPQPPLQPLWKPHPSAVWVPVPGVETEEWVRSDDGNWERFAVRVSDQGFRGPELGPKAPDEFRVLMLGDSFTFGWGVGEGEDFASQVRRELAQEFDRPTSVINCSAIGYAPWQARAFLESHCLDYTPDVILLQLFPANDIPGTLTKLDRRLATWQIWEENIAFWRRHPKRAQLDRWLRARWKTWHLFWYAAQHNDRLGAALGALPFNPPHHWPEQPRSLRQPLLEVNLAEWYPELELGWNEFQSDVLSIVAIAQDRGIPTYLYALPHPVVSQEKWARRMGRLHELGNPPDYVHHKDTRVAEEFFQEHDLNWIPILDSMLEHPDPDSLYLLRDGHLSVEGGAFVAELLAGELGSARARRIR